MILPEARVFELSDSIIEDFIFAMEDQDGSWLVDLETGELIQLEGEEAEGAAEEGGEERDLSDGERYAAPPEWSSREGFKLMEGFLGTVRQPSARNDLGAALSRGKGVFKAFKEALAAHPELDKAFRDYKAREMRRSIAAWHDEQRELRGLARLGAEPEDTGDLVESDLGISLGGKDDLIRLALPLLAEAELEALERLPEAVAAREAELLRARLATGEWIGAWADNGEGGAIAVAAAERERSAGRAFGRLSFIFVQKPFRRAGLGSALVGALAEAFRAEGTGVLVLDAPLAPADFGRALESTGFKPYGLRSISLG